MSALVTPSSNDQLASADPIEQPRTNHPTSAVRRLRDATRSYHDQVDAAFSGFDLADRDEYGRFLLAHVQATSAAEAGLCDDPTLPAWRGRTQLLADDLAQLGLAMPPPLEFKPPESASWRWGVLYVLEGSRLGGSILVTRTAPGSPNTFLSSRHQAGEWRTLLQAIDVVGSALGSVWIATAIAGACACFDLYRRAALRMTP